MRVAAAVAMVLAGAGVGAAPDVPEDTVEFRAHQHFGLSVQAAWTARLAGAAVTVERTGRKVRVRTVSQREMVALRRVLAQSRFSELEERYGCLGSCSDFNECRLEVSQGGRVHKVVVYSPAAQPGDGAQVWRFMSAWKAVKRVAGLSGLKDACP